MPKFTINAMPLYGTPEQMRNQNLEVAKNFIKKGNDFQPTVFIMTSKSTYYVALDTEMAAERKSSPMDQVKPIIEQFLKNEPVLGEMIAYQVIGEAWMKVFRKTKGKEIPPIGYGDIAQMADRVELLMETLVRKGKDKSFRTFEMIRELNSDKLIEFKKMKNDNKMESTKFPLIPTAKTTWTGDFGLE